MEGISRYLRLRTAMVGAALLAAALAAMTVSEPANALVYANDISIRVVNNSQTPISAAFCPNGHVSWDYRLGIRKGDPCNVTPFVTTIAGNGGRYPVGPWPNNPHPYTANPLGVVVRGNGKTLYFYASNPQIGLPFFEANGAKVELVQGELQTRHPDGATVRFHREGDIKGGLNAPTNKVMTIEIIRM